MRRGRLSIIKLERESILPFRDFPHGGLWVECIAVIGQLERVLS